MKKREIRKFIVMIMGIILLVSEVQLFSGDNVYASTKTSRYEQLYVPSYAAMSGKMLYYAVGSGAQGGRLYMYNTSTKRQKKISDLRCTDLTITKKNIYCTVNKYIGSDARNRYVYRMSKDGKKTKVLAEGYSPVVVGKYIYYMPDFTGIGQAEAVEQVEKMGLHAKIETQESEIARDYICDQQYKEGEKVDKGSEILLKVSIGNSGYDESVETTIPDVVGETWENARKCAREKKIYIYKEETLNDSKVAQGNVIKQNHKSGEKEKQGFVLGVKVSLGVKMTHVPDVVYKSLEDARKLMDESNLQIEVEYEQSDKVEKDHVISQSIKPDTEVEEKTIIKLVVSKGNDFEDNSEATSDTEETTEITTEDTPTTAQETTTEEETTEEPEPDDEPTKAIVPDLSGCSEDSAISMLYDAGLSVGSIEYRSDPNSYDGAVLSQGVSAYSEVDYGTSVSLIICNNEKDESGNYICPEY